MKKVTVVDIKGDIHQLDVSESNIKNFRYEYPHWGWWLVWAVVWIPFWIVLFFMRKKVCVVHYLGKEYILIEESGIKLLESKADL